MDTKFNTGNTRKPKGATEAYKASSGGESDIATDLEISRLKDALYGTVSKLYDETGIQGLAYFTAQYMLQCVELHAKAIQKQQMATISLEKLFESFKESLKNE